MSKPKIRALERQQRQHAKREKREKREKRQLRQTSEEQTKTLLSNGAHGRRMMTLKAKTARAECNARAAKTTN